MAQGVLYPFCFLLSFFFVFVFVLFSFLPLLPQRVFFATRDVGVEPTKIHGVTGDRGRGIMESSTSNAVSSISLLYEEYLQGGGGLYFG